MTSTERLLKGLLPAALLMACITAGMPAQAFYLSGSFSGTAQADQSLNLPTPRPESYYDDAPVSGSFQVNVPANLDGAWMSVSYRIKDESFEFSARSPDAANAGSSNVLVLNASSSPSSQWLSFSTDYRPRFEGAQFSLTGPADSLFFGNDLSTLHFDPSAPPLFSTWFASSRANMQIGVDVTQVNYQPAAPIPEPARALTPFR